MIVKINKTKYRNIDYARLKELVVFTINLSEYEIYIEFDSTNWLQVFKENNFISISHRNDKKVSHYLRLSEEKNVNDIIKKYYFDKKLLLNQNPDEVISIKNKTIFNWIGLIIIILSLFFGFLLKDNNKKYFDISCLFFPVGIVLITLKKFINKEYDTRNDMMFFGGIALFIFFLYSILFR